MTRTVIHFHNLATEQGYIDRNPTFVAAVELGGVRTFLAVPMMKENELIGVVIVYRQEVRPFSDKQIEVVKSFRFCSRCLKAPWQMQRGFVRPVSATCCFMKAADVSGSLQRIMNRLPLPRFAAASRCLNLIRKPP